MPVLFRFEYFIFFIIPFYYSRFSFNFDFFLFFFVFLVAFVVFYADKLFLLFLSSFLLLVVTNVRTFVAELSTTSSIIPSTK